MKRCIKKCRNVVYFLSIPTFCWKKWLKIKISCFLTGSSLTAGSLLGSFTGNAGLSGAGSLGTLLAAGKGENLSGEDWSNMVQILRLQMMMNMGKDTGTLI